MVNSLFSNLFFNVMKTEVLLCQYTIFISANELIAMSDEQAAIIIQKSKYLLLIQIKIK